MMNARQRSLDVNMITTEMEVTKLPAVINADFLIACDVALYPSGLSALEARKMDGRVLLVQSPSS